MEKYRIQKSRSVQKQGIFSGPQLIPSGANSLSFLLTYVVKEAATEKARALYNGPPRMQGTVNLGQAYAASLDQITSKTFGR